jgi:hypothetical protein
MVTFSCMERLDVYINTDNADLQPLEIILANTYSIPVALSGASTC